jgi:lipopolysaccharide export system permease protein
VLGLFVVLDLASHLDDFLTRSQGASSLALLGEYYLLSLPFLFLQGAPFITFGAGAYTLVRLVQTNEWMAVLGAGISSRRMLAPMLVLALMLAGAILAFRDVVTEELAQRRDLVYGRLIWGEERSWAEKIWVRDRQGRPFFVERFQMSEGSADEATIEGLEADLVFDDQWTRFRAEKAHYKREGRRGQWLLEGATLESEDATRQRELSPEKLVVLDFEPRDVLAASKMSRDPEKLSGAEVQALVARDPDNMQLRTIEQSLWAYPFANLIFLLVGLPLALSAEKRRVLRGVLIGVILCFFYFVFDFVCRSLGMEGALSPIIAGWMPVLLFGSLGIVLTTALST